MKVLGAVRLAILQHTISFRQHNFQTLDGEMTAMCCDVMCAAVENG